MLGPYGALGMLLLSGLAFIYPVPMAWIYVFAFALFEIWLVRRIAVLGRTPVPVDEPPYHFTAEEARLIAEYRLYFTYPAIARGASSVLAALGLSALILAPWLTYRQVFFPAVLVALNLLAVGKLTKVLAPVMALRIAASRGDREALRMLEVHDPAWAKIRAVNEEAG